MGGWEALLSRGAGRGRHRRGGARAHRPFSEPSSAQGFRPFSPAKPFAAGPAQSPRKGDASPASAWRNASPPALRHIREGAFARQPRAWRVAGNPTFTVSLAPICGHTSATSRAPEGAWCRQRPGWEGHRPGDLWGGIWTRPVRKYLPLLLASEGRAQGWFRGSVWLGHTSETRKDQAQLRPLKRPPLCFLSLSARKTLSIKVCPLG